MLTTVEEADLYILNNVVFQAPWLSADTDAKTIALKHATKIINNLPIQYDKASSAQEDVFPVTGQSAVPSDVKEACADIALSLLDGNDPDEMLAELRVSSQAIGSVKQNFFQDKAPPTHIVYGVPSATAWRKLAPWVDLTPNNRFVIHRV
jgi:hypothetical protein